MSFLKKFISEKKGLTYLEYALIAALVVTVGVTAFTNLGTAITGRIDTVTADVTPSP